jgi:uncharacterized protein (DUF2147 family)
MILHPHRCVFVPLLITLLAVAAVGAQQLSPKLQNAVGHWQVLDGNGKPGGQVDTYLVDGKLFGRDKCSGDNKNQLILSMVIMRDFHPDGDDWVGGTVLDPENGKVYQGKIWAEGKDKLNMRGFIGIPLLGRTATWVRLP